MVKSVCVGYVGDRTVSAGTCVGLYGLLQSRGSFMAVVSVSRWLHVRGRCHVPLSILFGPPVIRRASLVHVSYWLLVATSAIM